MQEAGVRYYYEYPKSTTEMAMEDETLCLECSKIITKEDKSPDSNYCAECYYGYQNELGQKRKMKPQS